MKMLIHLFELRIETNFYLYDPWIFFLATA